MCRVGKGAERRAHAVLTITSFSVGKIAANLA